ncbi:MAG: Type III pantothenate kinase [Candidatus Latescibacteria bacterium ADurb.Bin168]|nr:MAG: Type III pantothenate kinase [Candidatus Latescibacteria bacterium ADurb.Bin168]
MSSFVAVDIGNSDVKFGLFEGRNLLQVERLETGLLTEIDAVGDLSQVAPRVAELLAGQRHAVIGAVVSWAAARVASLLAGNGTRVTSMTSLSGFGLKIDYEHGEPGVDRVAACAEAYARKGGPLVLVGAGTALHTNVVTGEGVYLGGAIMPGFRLMFEALTQGTDQIRAVSPSVPSRVIGRSTPECVQIGVYHSWLGGALRLVQRTCEEVGGNPALWLTGGQAEWLKSEFPEAEFDPDLTLKGLARALCGADRQDNRKSQSRSA